MTRGNRGRLRIRRIRRSFRAMSRPVAARLQRIQTCVPGHRCERLRFGTRLVETKRGWKRLADQGFEFRDDIRAVFRAADRDGWSSSHRHDSNRSTNAAAGRRYGWSVHGRSRRRLHYARSRWWSTRGRVAEERDVRRRSTKRRGGSRGGVWERIREASGEADSEAILRRNSGGLDLS